MKLFLLLALLPAISFAKSFVPTSFSANYEETVKSLINNKEKKSYGKIDYKFPGHLRFEVTKPNPTLFVVNPRESWLYQPAFTKGEKDQVTVQKSSNLPIIKFLDSVKDGIESSKLFTTKYDKNDVVLTFVKTIRKDMGFQQVVLHANKPAKDIKELGGFERITLTKIDGSKTNIKLMDIKENVSFPPGNFEFKPSANTKIIKAK